MAKVGPIAAEARRWCRELPSSGSPHTFVPSNQRVNLPQGRRALQNAIAEVIDLIEDVVSPLGVDHG